jgi:hypothetical protein
MRRYSEVCRNVEGVFPNLIAVVNYDSERRGRWEAVLRRGIETELLSSIIRCSLYLVRPPSTKDNQSLNMCKSLELCATHLLGLRRSPGEASDTQQTFLFDVVIVTFGSNGQIWQGTQASTLPDEIQNYCDLASRVSSMAKSGISILDIRGIARSEAEDIMQRVSTSSRLFGIGA